MLDEDYRYDEFKYDKDDYAEDGSAVIDAREASWTLDNSGDAQNRYPVEICEADPGLNLSDDELPDYYTLPGDGWTALDGAETRSFWSEARDEFAIA